MLKKSMAGLVIFFLAPMAAAAADYEKSFEQDTAAVWAACVEVAKKNYTLAEINAEQHFLTFWTGYSLTSNGFQVTASLEARPGGGTVVRLRPAKRQQLFAWGAGGRIAKKFLRQVDDQLKAGPQPGGHHSRQE